MPLSISVYAGRLRRAWSMLSLKHFDTATSEGRSKERYRRIALTTASGFAIRGVSAALSLITVPLVLSYLGTVQYGFWTLVSTAVTWFSLLGFNITGGLRNAVAEGYGQGDRDAVISYTSTATFVLVAISVIVLIGLLAVSPAVNWGAVLGVSSEIPRSVSQPATLTALILFLLALPAAIPGTVLGALQKQYVSNIVGLVGALITLPLLIFAIRRQASISWLLTSISAGGLAASAISHFALTRWSEPWLRFSFRAIRWSALRRIANTSVPLIGYQIGSLLVNETQQIVIARRLDLSTVANYAILMRVVVIVSSVIGLSTAGFLPALREAKERGDMTWMKLAFRRMVVFRVAIIGVASVGLVLFGNRLLALWLHRADVSFSGPTWIIMAIGMTCAVWVTAFVDFMSAMDDIWRQVALVLFNGIVSVTLSALLCKPFGLTGVMIGTYAVTVLLWSWIIPNMTIRHFARRGPNNRA